MRNVHVLSPIFAPCEESATPCRAVQQTFILWQQCPFFSKSPEAFRRARAKEQRRKFTHIECPRSCYAGKEGHVLTSNTWLEARRVLDRKYTIKHNIACFVLYFSTDMFAGDETVWPLMLISGLAASINFSSLTAWCNYSPASAGSTTGSTATLNILTWATEMSETLILALTVKTMTATLQHRLCKSLRLETDNVFCSYTSLFSSNQLRVGHCTICHVEGNTMFL